MDGRHCSVHLPCLLRACACLTVPPAHTYINSAACLPALPSHHHPTSFCLTHLCHTHYMRAFAAQAATCATCTCLSWQHHTEPLSNDSLFVSLAHQTCGLKLAAPCCCCLRAVRATRAAPRACAWRFCLRISASYFVAACTRFAGVVMGVTVYHRRTNSGSSHRVRPRRTGYMRVLTGRYLTTEVSLFWT